MSHSPRYTSQERRIIRKRKERNLRLRHMITDFLGVTALGVIFYGVAIFAYGMGG